MGKEYITDALSISGTFCDYLGNPGTAGEVVTAAANGDRFDWETPSTPSTTYLKTRLVNTTIVNRNFMEITNCFNTTPEFSNGGVSVTSSRVITVTDAGVYKITAMVQTDSSSLRGNLNMSVAVNGAFNQAWAGMGYVRNIVGADESSTTWTGIVSLSAFSSIGLGFFNTTNTGLTSVIAGAKSSITMYKIGP